MPELYKILDPNDLPTGNSRLRDALLTMAVGDTIAAPLSDRTTIYYHAHQVGIRVSTKIGKDIVYVRRLPDDAS